jgi:hypothetical protein
MICSSWHHPVTLVQETHSLDVKQREREAQYSPLSITGVKDYLTL